MKNLREEDFDYLCKVFMYVVFNTIYFAKVPTWVNDYLFRLNTCSVGLDVDLEMLNELFPTLRQGDVFRFMICILIGVLIASKELSNLIQLAKSKIVAIISVLLVGGYVIATYAAYYGLNYYVEVEPQISALALIPCYVYIAWYLIFELRKPVESTTKGE